MAERQSPMSVGFARVSVRWGRHDEQARPVEAEVSDGPEISSRLDDSRKRCRRLSNSHCIAGATELSPSMPSPARSPRLLRAGACDLDVATAWLPKCWTATPRKRKGRPRRPPSLTAADRGKRPLSGLAFVRLMRRAGATASRVHLTPRAAGAPSAPTEAPPWPLPTDALGHRRSPAWPRS